ncbi:MAG: hypothetical protein KC503_33550 [Myxococcales bacterium]|nr:hypothetical protein [Myxococcales bacterium]
MVCRKNVGGTTPPPPTPDAGPPPSGDTTPPSVMITSPSAGASLSGSVKVVVNASDDQGVASVELRVDDQPVSTLNAAPYEFTITLEPGAHVLSAVARDASGNAGQASVAVTATAGGGTTPDPGGTPGTPDPGGTPPTPTTPTPTPGGGGGAGSFGALCNASTDCSSGLCLQDSAFNTRYCTQRCDNSSCPFAGASCETGAGGERLCVLATQGPGLAPDGQAPSGGCSVGSSPRSSPPTAGWLCLSLLALALLTRGRRRRR